MIDNKMFKKTVAINYIGLSDSDVNQSSGLSRLNYQQLAFYKSRKTSKLNT